MTRHAGRRLYPRTSRDSRYAADMDPDLLTYQDAAERMQVHPRTVRRWVHEGLLPAVKIGPRRLRIRPADLDAMIRPYHPRWTPDQK